MGQEIGERIKLLRQARGWTQAKLADLSDVERSNIARYEANISQMTAQTLQRIANALEVPITLLYGLTNDQAVGTMEAVLIPVLGKIPAGELKFTEDTVVGHLPAPADIVAGGICFYLQISGNCMAPSYRDGDLAMVRVQPEVENGEVAVIVVDNEDATLKRFSRRGEFVVLRGDNPSQEPIALPANRVRVIGKVVGFFRRDK